MLGNMCPDALESMSQAGDRGVSEHAKALATLTDGQLQHPVDLFI